MFFRKPSSLYRLLLVHLTLAVALFNLLKPVPVVASPVGTTHGPREVALAPTSSEYDIQFGRKRTGSDEWLPNSVDFAKDQEIILFIGNHLLRFQASPEPHIIHEQHTTLPPKDHCILLGPKRQTQLSLTIRPDEAKDFWALMVDIPKLEKEVHWKIIDDVDYNHAVETILMGDPKWGRLTPVQMREWVDIELIRSVLRNNRSVEPMSPSAMPKM
ncbi:hypothetical protein DFH05DRAFT_1502378 [Lentinula detonsa]|uniref:Uncharacterized protein n=1 Tax=Lentinula detonsa TaxID=2804962 RepID=A0A9W8NVP5_9AGAR|nr:hypothetical protein DFH05DRAFT_1502378 [Lentinula detonsa]